MNILVITHISEGQKTLKCEGFGDRDPAGGYNFANVGNAASRFQTEVEVRHGVPDLLLLKEGRKEAQESQKMSVDMSLRRVLNRTTPLFFFLRLFPFL